MSIAEPKVPLLAFFSLVFALSIPLWLIGAATGLQLVPGLPVSALMAFCPLIAAAILVYRKDGTAGVSALLRRSFDYDRIAAKVWYLPIFLLVPGLLVAAYGLMRWLQMPLPEPRFSALGALVLFVVFFVAGLGEEVGWSGYATDPLQKRWNALAASLVLGAVRAAWHIVPLLQAHRALAWIAWWCLGTLGLRVLTVWIYNNTGRSVFATILFHDVCNVGWLLFPNGGSHYVRASSHRWLRAPPRSSRSCGARKPWRGTEWPSSLSRSASAS